MTIYKNINPVWEQQFALYVNAFLGICSIKHKEFISFVKDMYEVLEITVFDEDPNRIEFLGKLVIPLLEVKHLILFTF